MGTAIKPTDPAFWAPTIIRPQEPDHPIEDNPTEPKDVVSSSISQTWTDQAIKCHLTKADCANCSVFRGHYSFTCQMNKVVPILLSNLGEPDPLRVEKLLPFIYD